MQHVENPPERASRWHRLWDRELQHYPETGPRLFNLGLVVVITIVLYYEVYLQGGVATHILREFDISFTWWVNMAVIGYVGAAIASYLAGILDRFGRGNVVIVGFLLTVLLSLLAVPNVETKLQLGVVLVAISFVEGIVLVATPTLIRDFSPQLGRAAAMSFWTLGPVLGALVVSLMVSQSSDEAAWQRQYVICGVIGLVVWVVALFRLRELAPALRNQLMVSERDRALLEARARGIDATAALHKPYRQVFRLDIVLSALAISVFLIIYYVERGYFPIYFQTIFGYTQSAANGLSNWFAASMAGALLVVGIASDRLGVRKPFMLVGAIGAVVFTSLFALTATRPDTSHGTFVVLLVGMAVCVGTVYGPWMASFSETIERRNPALTANGMSVYGTVIRLVIALTAFVMPYVVTTVTTLVNDGPRAAATVAGEAPELDATQNATVKAVAADPMIVTRVQEAAQTYAAEVATAAKLTDSTKAALAETPGDTGVQAQALSEISGVALADVTRVLTLSERYRAELATAQAVDDSTKARLLQDPTDAAAQASAVAQVAAAFGLSGPEAAVRLQAVLAVGPTDLAFMAATGTTVRAAGEELAALAAVPAAELALLATHGTQLQDPTVQASLTWLQEHGPKVQSAVEDSPKQWQNYFWAAVAGQLVFIPLIFVMAGFWSPRRARQSRREHDELVAMEMARLGLERGDEVPVG